MPLNREQSPKIIELDIFWRYVAPWIVNVANQQSFISKFEYVVTTMPVGSATDDIQVTEAYFAYNLKDAWSEV